MIEVFASGDASGATDRANVQAALNSGADYYTRCRGTPVYFNDWLTVPATLPRRIQFDGASAGGVVWVPNAPRVGFECQMTHPNYPVEIEDALLVCYGARDTAIHFAYPYTVVQPSYAGPAVRRVQIRGAGNPAVDYFKTPIVSEHVWNGVYERIHTRGQVDVWDETNGARHVTFLGKCNGVELSHVYGMDGYRHIEIVGAECEGFVLDTGSMVGGRQGCVQYAPGAYVPPGWTVRNYHTNVDEVGLYFARAAQINIDNYNAYRLGTAREWWGLRLHHAVGPISLATVVNSHAFAGGDARATGFELAGTAVDAARLKGQGVHDVVRVLPISSGSVQDCAGLNLVALPDESGLACRNLAGALVVERNNRYF